MWPIHYLLGTRCMRLCFPGQYFRTFKSSSKEYNRTNTQEVKDLPITMAAWQMNGYNGIHCLKFTETEDIPLLIRPNDVLVEVKAASVNAIDVMMTEGYGCQIFEKINCQLNYGNLMETRQMSLPLTLGRDFAGVIQAIGGGVTEFQTGDEVMGVIPPPLTGSHKQYIVTQSCNMKIKPDNLTMEQAASIPYAGMTAWSALQITAELFLGSRDKKILIMGASGGVGTIAVQLLKAWDSTVVTTSSADAFSYLTELGSDFVVDYTSSDAEAELQQFGGFDVILDCTGRGNNYSYSLLKPWSNAKYVTLSPPTLRNFDEHGFVGGIVKNGLDLLAANSSAILEGKTLRWAFFVPSSSVLGHIKDLAAEKKLKAVIDSVFPFDRLPDAYARMKAGHTRGKVVVQM